MKKKLFLVVCAFFLVSFPTLAFTWAIDCIRHTARCCEQRELIRRRNGGNGEVCAFCVQKIIMPKYHER